MMFEVAVGDRIRAVTVVRKGALLHVTLDGRTRVIDARRVSDSEMSLLVQNDAGKAPVHSVDAAFAARPAAGDFDVHLAGRSIAVQVRQAGSFGRQKKEGGGASGSGPQRVVAPMPGKIVRILVKAGDSVKAKQGLVVVEAMKMENELRASRAGRVKFIKVAEGQSVEAGTLLVTVE
jgi:biotin carboxyl carrier protein